MDTSADISGWPLYLSVFMVCRQYSPQTQVTIPVSESTPGRRLHKPFLRPKSFDLTPVSTRMISHQSTVRAICKRNPFNLTPQRRPSCSLMRLHILPPNHLVSHRIQVQPCSCGPEDAGVVQLRAQVLHGTHQSCLLEAVGDADERVK